MTKAVTGYRTPKKAIPVTSTTPALPPDVLKVSDLFTADCSATDLRAINEKPFETVQEWIGVLDHRAKATVLMRSLRVTLHSLKKRSIFLLACGSYTITTGQETLETRLNGIHVRTH